MSLYMRTTAVADSRTRGEIIKLLEQNCGATSITLDNTSEDQQHITWVMPVPGILNLRHSYKLPVRVKAVYQTLRNQRTPRGRLRTDTEKSDMARARMIAWRQALRWLQAQVAYMDTGQVQSIEVFLPYMVSAEGKTVFEQYQSSFHLLEAPKP